MKKTLKTVAVAAAGLAMMASLTACSGLKGLDVVGKQSITSFEEVLKTIPDQVQANDLNVGWSLEAPDGSARFIWSEDYSKAPLHDVMLELDSKPFVKAGLTITKLPKNYTAYDDMLMVGKKLGDDKLTYQGDSTPLGAYEKIVEKYRDSINYHTSLDHYGVKLGDGNMFEWAKDMETNGYNNENQDKDIVFVLNPEPLISAGVDPKKVEGWVYAQVPVEENGKTEQVWKLLKPFNLK
ncbi:MAG: hypothetical protein BGN88_10055 [Clostridiales bacterium 43-6]|nr:MAG: hypothetical protein BGN88_10055 [Clostridiales bacterium 43-6]